MTRRRVRSAAILALVGVLVPVLLLGVYNLRKVNPRQPTVEQRIAGALIPFLYPGAVFMGAMIGVEESGPRYHRELFAVGALSLVANAAIYVLTGYLVRGALAIYRRQGP